MMRLNTLKPAKKSKPKKVRLGRGIGSGLGKTAGRGHKGQRARAGGYHKVGFEGGQTPLQRRLPKYGFKSLKKRDIIDLRLSSLNKIEENTPITLNLLKEKNMVPVLVKKVKIILHGKLEKPVKIVGLQVTKGARKAIEEAGGSIVEVEAA